MVEPNGVCQWCDVPHGGHQNECPAGERDKLIEGLGAELRSHRDVLKTAEDLIAAGDFQGAFTYLGRSIRNADYALRVYGQLYGDKPGQAST